MELGRTSPAFRSVIGTNNGIGSQGLVMDGTAAQKAHYLPKMASGEIIGSFALTEPEAGSDAGSLKTSRASRAMAVLSSTAPSASSRTRRKRSCSPCSRAPIRTRRIRRAYRRFWSMPTSKGITLGPKNRKMGQQGAHVCDVIFDDCWVPESALLGGPANLNKGFLTAMKTLDRGRLHISALAVGCAERLIARQSELRARTQSSSAKRSRSFS